MLVYNKVAWYLDNTNNIAQFSLGKEKYRLIKRGFSSMDQEGYTYGCVPINHDFLEEFSSLYTNYIQQKNNAHLADIVGIYTPRIGKEDIYFAYVRDPNGKLLAGAIYVHKILRNKKTLVLSFRASTQSFFYGKIHLGYYIEYLFFDCGLSLAVEQFSRGRDRNGYGFLGSSIGLCLHKLQLHFLPHVVNDPLVINVDENDISQDCVFFVDPNDKNYFTRIVLYTSDVTLHENFVLLVRKRGLVVDIIPRSLDE